LSENVTPEPAVPQPASYPSHAPSGAISGNEPPYGPPQPYAPPAPPAYGQQQYLQPQYAPYPPPQQYAPAMQWQPGPPRMKSSGYRVASGIVGIVLGAWLIIPSIAGFQQTGGVIFMAFLILVAALGNITAGIVLLANQRNRTMGAPVTSLAFAGFAMLLGLLGLVVTYFGIALFVSCLLLATPVLIIMGIGLSRERVGA
jgi:hypothetical protein